MNKQRTWGIQVSISNFKAAAREERAGTIHTTPATVVGSAVGFYYCT